MPIFKCINYINKQKVSLKSDIQVCASKISNKSQLWIVSEVRTSLFKIEIKIR